MDYLTTLGPLLSGLLLVIFYCHVQTREGDAAAVLTAGTLALSGTALRRGAGERGAQHG